MCYQLLALVEGAKSLALPVTVAVGNVEVNTIPRHASVITNKVDHNRKVAVGIELCVAHSDQQVTHCRRVAPRGSETHRQVAGP